MKPLLIKCGIGIALVLLLIWWLDARFLLTPDLSPEQVATYFVQYALHGWTDQIENDADALLTRRYQSTDWPAMRDQADSCENEVEIENLSIIRSSFHRGERSRLSTAFVEIEATDIFFPEDSNEIRDLRFSVSLAAIAMTTPILRRPYRRWRVNVVEYEPM